LVVKWERKNWTILNARVLVWRFLIYSDQMRWVRKISTSIVEHCLIPPNWLEWMKLLEIKWNWSHSSMTFSISFFKIFRRTMQQNILGESYNTLLGLGMIMKDNFLKWDCQWLVLIHAFVILMILLRYLSFLINALRCFQEIQFGPGVDKLLHLIMVLLNSSLEKDNQTDIGFNRISSRILRFIHQFCLE